MPWTAFRLNQQQDAFVVNTDQATVQQTPGFDQAAIDRGDPNWDVTVDAHYRLGFRHSAVLGRPYGRPLTLTTV